jgi:hypothetical protein
MPFRQKSEQAFTPCFFYYRAKKQRFTQLSEGFYRSIAMQSGNYCQTGIEGQQRGFLSAAARFAAYLSAFTFT